jgi:hypothetical protein
VELRLTGYLPKHVVARPASLDAPAVADICSLSNCISSGPEEWTPLAQFNALGFFDSPELAIAAIPPGSPPMTLFAYKLLRQRYVDGVSEEYPWPSVVPTPLPAGFQPLGFDVVNHSMGERIHFECSPLSCNGRAQQWGANTHCLIDTLELAIRAAAQFSTDGLEPVEPGDYYVAQVYRQV